MPWCLHQISNNRIQRHRIRELEKRCFKSEVHRLPCAVTSRTQAIPGDPQLILTTYLVVMIKHQREALAGQEELILAHSFRVEPPQWGAHSSGNWRPWVTLHPQPADRDGCSWHLFLFRFLQNCSLWNGAAGPNLDNSSQSHPKSNLILILTSWQWNSGQGRGDFFTSQRENEVLERWIFSLNWAGLEYDAHCNNPWERERAPWGNHKSLWRQEGHRCERPGFHSRAPLWWEGEWGWISSAVESGKLLPSSRLHCRRALSWKQRGTKHVRKPEWQRNTRQALRCQDVSARAVGDGWRDLKATRNVGQGLQWHLLLSCDSNPVTPNSIRLSQMLLLLLDFSLSPQENLF